MLNIPVTADVRTQATALVVALLRRRVLGGKGSGNFGHSGRKGEVDGSGDAVDVDKLSIERIPGLPAAIKDRTILDRATTELHDRYTSQKVDHEALAHLFIIAAVRGGLAVQNVGKAHDREAYNERMRGNSARVSKLDAAAAKRERSFKLVASYAFRQGRQAIDVGRLRAALASKNRAGAQAAVAVAPSTVKAALSTMLPRVLLQTLADGGDIGYAALPKLKAAGGKGSGNFGHAGRKGEVGGSGEATGETRPLLHGTSEKSVRAILRQGIKASLSGKVYPDKSTKDHVYLTHNEREAQQFAVNAAHTLAFGKDGPRVAAVLEVRIPTNELGRLSQDSHNDLSRAARQFKGDIKPEWIRSIKVVTAGSGYNEVWKSVPLSKFRGATSVETFFMPWVLGIDDDELRAASDSPFNVRNPLTVKWAEQHAAELAKGISDTTRDYIANAIAGGLEGDADVDEVFDAILNAVGDEARAELIARTESMTAINEGQRQAWDQAVEDGLLTGNEKRVWIAALGCCDLCDELDEETTDLDGEYPGDGGDGPPLHPNCRCTEGIGAL